LPDVLRKNQFECLRAALGQQVGRRSDIPVESSMCELMRRVSLIRRRHQADCLGMGSSFNPNVPWILDLPAPSDDSGAAEAADNRAENQEPIAAHLADLIPDNPSDWIPYDPEIDPNPRAGGINFNIEEYGCFFRERYLYSDASSGEISNVDATGSTIHRQQELEGGCSFSSENAYKILHETARVLKDGGNEALHKGQLDVAARRYDKAIRYCSVPFMKHKAAMSYAGTYREEVILLAMKLNELDLDDEVSVPLLLKWSPLLKVLISTRLNLSMLLLKRAKLQCGVSHSEEAMKQAKRALWELQPFCTQKGKICIPYTKKGKEVHRQLPEADLTRINNVSSSLCDKAIGKRVKVAVLKMQEPIETYEEAKSLQAKAYFRLGSALLDRAGYREAVLNFEKSIEATLELNPDAKLDAVIVRRLAEAKRQKTRQNKRRRKKFRFMFAQGDRRKSDKHTSRAAVSTPKVSAPGLTAGRKSEEEERGTHSE